jgi:copper chaperone CopZ
MTLYTFAIDGMGCKHCISSVKDALAALPGVKVKKVKLGSAVVKTESVPREAIIDAIKKAGYEVTD